MDLTTFEGAARTQAQAVPQQRIMQKLDDYMARNDLAGAERHLLYWLEEALVVGDKRGELMVRNELVGHFRKTGNRDQAFAHAEAALALVDELGFQETISAGTTFTNAATAFCAFGAHERAIELFAKATRVYEDSPHTEPQLLGGLYNNKALALVALGRFDEAGELYAKALDVMARVENGQLEQAITYLNMADAAVAQAKAGIEAQAAALDEEQIDLDALAISEDAVERYLDTALDLLDTPTIPRDGYYAFVCEKCAPVFGHYGYFLAEADLRQRADALYA